MTGDERDEIMLSFSEIVKQELNAKETTTPARAKAELYGLLLLGGEFGVLSISLQTENASTAKQAAQLLAEELGVIAQVSYPLNRKGSRTTLAIEDREDRCRVMEYFGHRRNETGIRINPSVLPSTADKMAFLRGAFLAGGSVSDPNKGYRLEFNVPYQNLSESLMELLSDIPELELHPKLTQRKGSYVVYLKISEEITDLLTYMGAVQSSMEYMQVKMLKEVRNDVNRRTNFDTANIDKTVSAAAEQIRAISWLKEHGRLGKLSEELQKVAQARLDNPEMSLRELELALGKTVSRSGLNHRLQKLVSLAKEESGGDYHNEE